MTGNHRWQRICHPDELKAGGTIEFTLPRNAAAPDAVAPRGFALLHNGTARAYVNRCPHLGIELNWMPGRFMDTDNCFIQCATHGALFLPDNGECISGPCQGEALAPLDVAERSDGIYISCRE